LWLRVWLISMAVFSTCRPRYNETTLKAVGIHLRADMIDTTGLPCFLGAVTMPRASQQMFLAKVYWTWRRRAPSAARL
jgi:hypothetical protein